MAIKSVFVVGFFLLIFLSLLFLVLLLGEAVMPSQ